PAPDFSDLAQHDLLHPAIDVERAQLLPHLARGGANALLGTATGVAAVLADEPAQHGELFERGLQDALHDQKHVLDHRDVGRGAAVHQSISSDSISRAASNSSSGRRTESSAMSRKYMARKLAGSSYCGFSSTGSGSAPASSVSTSASSWVTTASRTPRSSGKSS